MRWPKAPPRFAKALRVRPRFAAGAIAAVLLIAGTTGWLLIRATRRAAPRPDLVQVAVTPAPRPDWVVTFAAGCTTSRCHADLASAPVLHPASAKGACKLCHAPDAGGHTYPLLQPRGSQCVSCHDTGGKHPFQHKAMTDDGCLACHAPHGSRAAALLVADTLKAACANCHIREEHPVQHAPYAEGSCDTCHDPHGGSTRDLLKTRTLAEQCRTCHAEVVGAMETATHTHNGVERSCLACHSPHAADQKALLAVPTRDLCMSCHPDVAGTVATAKVSHDPVLKDQQCVTCHDPHASGIPFMLRNTQAAVCLSCHDKPVVASDGRKIPELAKQLADSPVVHGAVTLGNCADCHSVHGGAVKGLLREASAKVNLGSYDEKNFALCLSCHDRSLVAAGGETLFRNGDRNLHEVHLRAGDKPRTCAACHAVHAGDLPRLIARTVSFEGSNWQMPMNFTITPDGGRCGPGCHEPLEYRRNVPLKGGAR